MRQNSVDLSGLAQPGEVSLAAARAAVMVYDDTNKKWIPSGSSSGLSKVHVYHHTINNTFRVVGRKLHDHEVVINCALLKGLKYNQATPTFHQWRDSKQVYGLNFSSKDDADAFAAAMLRAIEVINGHVVRPAPTPPAPSITPLNLNNQYANQNNHHQQQQNVYQSVNNGYDEDNYRSRDDVAPNTIERRSSQNSLGSLNHSVSTPTIQNAPQPMTSPSGGGHHRASSAPTPPQPMTQAPQPPPVPAGVPGILTQGAPPPPPAPPQFGGSPMAPPPQFANTGGVSPPVNGGPPAPTTGGPPPPPMPGGPPVSAGPPVPPPMSMNGPPAPPMMNSAPPPAPPSMNGPPMPMMSGPPTPMMGGGGPMIGGGGSMIGGGGPMMSGGGPMLSGGGPMMSGGGPPPPPPPMMPLLSRQNSGMDSNSLTNALQNVRLKKSVKHSIDSGASSSSSSSAGSTYGTIGKGASERASLSGSGVGMVSMMDEMQRTLARRKAISERQDTGSGGASSQDEGDQRKYNTISTTNGRLNNGNAESPKNGRKRLGSSGDEASPRVNGKQEGGSLDLESFKQEIIKEVRLEIQKAKQEIIDAIRIELSRR